MKIIIIYGPPGVGKMSVAKELSKETKYKILPHNILLNLITGLSDLKLSNSQLWETYEKIKINLINCLIENKKNLIITEVYNEDNKKTIKRLKKFINYVKNKNIGLYFVRLACDESELFKRVSNKKRKNQMKLNNKKELSALMKKEKLDFSIRFVKSLIIDTTKLSAKNTAKLIKQKLKLK